jgi:uncharacterized membrane protein
MAQRETALDTVGDTQSLPMAVPLVGGRFDFIDALRGVGLLCMVIDHAYDWWLIAAENQGSWGRSTVFVGTLAAPIFMVLVGVSMTLATAGRRARGMTAGRATWLLVRRGVIIWLWGYLVNFLVFFRGDNWIDLLAFDVLQCIGVGMVLLAPVAVWGPVWVVALLALGFGWGGQFADHLNLPAYLGTAVAGIPPIAYFPLLPWLCFVPIGMLWGRALVRWGYDRATADRLAAWLLPAGMVLLACAALVPNDIGYRHPRPVTILFELAVVAWAGTALYGLHRWAWGVKWSAWLRTLGSETLLLYVFHHLLGFRLFSALGWVTGRAWRGQYGVFDIPAATVLLLALCGVMYLVARAWSRWKARPGAWQRAVRIWM